MIDIPAVLMLIRTGAEWSLNGDTLDGLTMLDGTDPPTQAEIEAAWPAVEAARWTATMRAERDRLLAACDWTQLPDAMCDRQAWADYRQALRDFPATWTPSPVANFPDPPA